MSEKRLLTILGSPNKNGTSAAMLSCAESTASIAGWHVDRINLYEKRIGFCHGCRACIETRTCVQDDDMSEIVDLLRCCNAVVLAAPTYWANVPAAVKNLFDRLLGVAMEETNTFPKGRLSSAQKYLIMTSCNTPYPFSSVFGQSSGTLRAMKEFFKTSGMTQMGSVAFSGAKGKSQLPNRIEVKIRRCWK